ncbi:flagellar biosynthesis protein FlgB [Jannaschia sp. Os4]|uniref:flagellar basal body protein n=1 Tax=Jannaschia sp. Os4 TaxID=2807617 RepID=UPI00193AC27A|nr:flagellar basal body protein [Jannaschia sp. Os4]MBM2575656.1 flagellar biosynthesis protein FlgB [Jannaschia sp. Os4]
MDVALFDLASRRMEWLAQDQRVVAENVANSDTPGFKARRIEDFAAVLSNAAPSGPATTDAAHIPGLGGAGSARVSEDPAAWATTLDGNSVVLEQQAIRSAQIDGAYGLAATLYKKGHDFIRLAAAGNL